MKALYLTGLGLSLALLSCKKDPGTGSREAVAEAGYELTPEALFRAAESDDIKALKGMAAAGSSLELVDASGRSLLHAAAGEGATKSMDFLLDRGLDVDLVDQQGRTPLMEAVIRADGTTVRYLLAQGADPRAKDSNKYKPLMLAVREGRDVMVAELAPYVREDLDDALLVASILGQAAVVDELTNYGASVYARLDDGRTPLMLAAQNGRDEAADMLLAIGANRFGMDDAGHTAADLAREAGHLELADRLAGAPVAGDFELSEPAELGAEMVAVVTEEQVARVGSPVVEGEEVASNEDEGEGGGSGAVPWDSPVTGQGGGTLDTLPESPRTPLQTSLEGAILGKSSGGSSRPSDAASVESIASTEGDVATSAASAIPMVMRAYREKELPLRVDSTTEDTATLRVAGGEPVAVEEGSEIPGSSLQIVHITRRMQSGKNDGGAPVEVSVVAVKDAQSGVERELIVGLPALAHDPVALVEDSATGRYYVARTGQRFRAADGDDYLVGDVRPNQIVIENLKSGETTTLPLRGPRG